MALLEKDHGAEVQMLRFRHENVMGQVGIMCTVMQSFRDDVDRADRRTTEVTTMMQGMLTMEVQRSREREEKFEQWLLRMAKEAAERQEADRAEREEERKADRAERKEERDAASMERRLMMEVLLKALQKN